MSELTEALGRAIPIFRQGGLSGAMYRTEDVEDLDGFAIDYRDWALINDAARKYAALTSPETKEMIARTIWDACHDASNEWLSWDDMLLYNNPEDVKDWRAGSWRFVAEAVLRAVTEDTQ